MRGKAFRAYCLPFDGPKSISNSTLRQAAIAQLYFVDTSTTFGTSARSRDKTLPRSAIPSNSSHSKKPAPGARKNADMSETEAKRSNRRLIAIAALTVVLLAQGAYSFGDRPEPYPTIRMPSFGGVPNADGRVSGSGLDITLHYTDGTTMSPNPVDLAGDIRYSSARASLDYAFRSSGAGERNARTADPELVEWLRNRSVEAGSGAIPDSIEFCWRKTIIDITDGNVASTDPRETTRVDLRVPARKLCCSCATTSISCASRTARMRDGAPNYPSMHEALRTCRLGDRRQHDLRQKSWAEPRAHGT